MQEKQLFFIKDGNTIHRLKQEQIIYIAVEDKYCTIYTFQGKRFILRKSLKNISKVLAPQSFTQIHRSHIVTVIYIDVIDLKQNRIKICNRWFPIGRSFKQVLIKKINPL